MRDERPWLSIHLASFAVFGAVYGVWQVLLPELSRDVAPGTGELGAALSIGFVGSLPAMAIGGRLADRLGARPVGVVSGVVFGLAAAAFGLVGGYVGLLATVAVFYAASGAYDVAINAAAIDWETDTGRRALTMLHAGFSGGAMVAAAAAGLALAAGVEYRVLYPIAGASAVAVGIGWWRMSSRPAARPARAGDAPPSKDRLFRHRLLLALGAITGLAFFVEAALESWSAIYLRGVIGLPVLLGSAGVAFFHGAMLTGRLGSIGLQRRFGRRRAVVASGLVLALGMIGALATDVPALVIGGFVLVGLAVSGVAPAAFSLAGEAVPGRSGGASAVVTVIGYSGFLAAPGIIGGVAELTGLGIALAMVIVAGLLISALTGRLVVRQRAI